MLVRCAHLSSDQAYWALPPVQRIVITDKSYAADMTSKYTGIQNPYIDTTLVMSQTNHKSSTILQHR